MTIRRADPDDILEFPSTGQAYFRKDLEAMGEAALHIADLTEPQIYTRDHPLYEQRARELHDASGGRQ